MRARLAFALLLTCAACSQDDAPADEVAAAAEEIVEPAAEPLPVAAGKWAPRDDCAALEGASAFRERLAAAVEARDADALAALAADDIKLDFGGGSGTAELRRRLAASPGLWDELDALMSLGCAANGQGGMTIPWYFEQDFGTLDPVETSLVTAEDVPVLDRPDEGGKRVAAVSWDTVKVVGYRPDAPFQQVELADGTTGSIASGKLRSLVDYRLIASSRSGRWRIATIVAGD